MKFTKVLPLSITLLGIGVISFANNFSVKTIDDYNSLLPVWGTSWSPGAKSVNGYYPTFYTGFAMRQQTPERIHIRVGRGNQTRITVILDDQALTDYPFDLVKRYEIYKGLTSGPGAKLNINPSGAKLLPQLDFFNQIIESPTYDILGFVDRASKGAESPENTYAKSLNILRSLNPGRVFILNLNLTQEFAKWKAYAQRVSGGNPAKITGQPQEAITAINTLLFGRINYTQKPTADVLAKLTKAITLATNGASENDFTRAALDLFQAVTGTKYDFRVVNNQGQWQKALQCSSSASCYLSYPEFTAIYPTGSVEETTTDEFGNRINAYATPGLWQFLSRSGGRDVDNIRNEPYYGFAPKMDYQDIGNGFHNPAVRFWDPSKAVKQALGLNPAHNTYWAVKRGGVSHGCLRFSIGGVWEFRQIIPVENSKMTKVSFFGNRAQDFDLYDIDGSGELKVMGTEYFISYGLQGADSTARREGKGLEINADKKHEFYTSLYGAKNVFIVNEQQEYIFTNPRISLPSYLDFQKASVSTRLQIPGQYKLYEQTYEKDKVQFYALGEMTPQNKLLARLMGRVRGCAPTSDKQLCGEAAFDQELKSLVK